MAWPVVGAMLASTVIGGVMQNKAAKQMAGAANKGKRNYLKEMQSALAAQEAIQPKMLQIERAYRPQWQQLEADMLKSQMGLTRGIQAEAARGSGEAGMGYAAEMAPALGYAGTEAMQLYRNMLGADTNALLSGLRSQALQDMSTGRALTLEQKIAAEQAARGAMQARGLQGGNQAVAMEVLMNEKAAADREAARRKFAADMYSMSVAEADKAYNMYGTPLTDLVQFANPKQLMGLSANLQAAAGPQIAQPESQYNANVYGANSQNAINTALAAAQTKAGIGAGIMQMGAKLGSAYLGNPAAFAGGGGGLPTGDVGGGWLSTGVQVAGGPKGATYGLDPYGNRVSILPE